MQMIGNTIIIKIIERASYVHLSLRTTGEALVIEGKYVWWELEWLPYVSVIDLFQQSRKQIYGLDKLLFKRDFD